MKTKYTLFFISLIAAFIFSACKKTVDYAPIPQNRISEYKVINLRDTVIYGAIDNIENTITVYIPYYYALDVIQPEIILDQGALLSGETAPVAVSEKDHTYTVTGTDGSTRVYSLEIVQQNPPSLNLYWATGNPEASPNASLGGLRGNLQSTSIASLDATLVSKKSGQTFKTDLSTANINPNNTTEDSYILSAGTLPASIDSGYYDVKISFLGHQVTLEKPVHIVYKSPQVALQGKTGVQGGTISFAPSPGYVFVDLKSVRVTVQGTTYDLPVDNFDRLQITVKIPENFPAGSFSSSPFVFQFGNWAASTRRMSLTVTAR